jgi:hypothetical protein
VVTPLTDALPELPLELELVEPLDCELVVAALPSDPELVLELVMVAGDELDATVAADERLASAGSCPDTSTIVMSSHDATNSATAPPMTRRRITRTRARRAFLIATPRARAA